MPAIEEVRKQLQNVRCFGPASLVFSLAALAVSARALPDNLCNTQIEFRELNPSSDIRFIKTDAAQLRNVDDVCQQIKAQEPRINLLFLCAGIFNFRGREEMPEGLDRKLAFDFYSRLRFTENLPPQLREAAKPAGVGSNAQPPWLASVVSVLGAGRESSIATSDLSLKYKYILKASTQHATTMTTLSFDKLAADPQNNRITFVHTRPGMVKTNGDRELGIVFRLLLTGFNWVFRAWTTPVQEVGERSMWVATSGALEPGRLHLVGQKMERLENVEVLKQLKADGTSGKVWEHTREVFQAICNDPAGKY